MGISIRAAAFLFVAGLTWFSASLDERSRPPLESPDTAANNGQVASPPPAFPQQGGRGQRGGRYGRGGTPVIDRTQYPQWQNDPNFQRDVFTFARLQYDGSGNTPDARWNNDFPDADLNLSFRLQQLTSLHVNPDGAVVRLERCPASSFDPSVAAGTYVRVLARRHGRRRSTALHGLL